MLREWQLKFPTSFLAFPVLFTKSAAFQSCLAMLLSTLEERRLLNEQVVADLLDNASDYLRELAYLIDKLVACDCLNPRMLQALLREPRTLASCTQDLTASVSLTADWLSLIFTAKDPISCVEFIKRAREFKVSFEFILNFLAHEVAMEGLRDAITLFDLSSFDYRREHFEQFLVLTWVLANPLCETIFHARARCFSDYEEPRERVTISMADDIIHKLHALPDEESRNQVFFNFFAAIRPLPCSQKYIVEIDMAAEVRWALTSYCESKIKAIESQQDYLDVNQMIRNLRAVGGDSVIFDKIKYSVARAVESEDMLSTRSYEVLMEEIWQTLNRPQTDLDTFTEELERTTGYLQLAGGAMRHLGLLTSSAAISLADGVSAPDAVSKPPVL